MSRHGHPDPPPVASIFVRGVLFGVVTSLVSVIIFGAVALWFIR